MKAGDISKSIFIVFIFILLYIFNLLSVGLAQIKKDWPQYRCNPAVMPFASFFGEDAMQNFTYCIQNMQTNFMGYLLQPLHYNFDLMGNITSTITDAINDVRQFFYKIRSFVGNLTGNIFSVFLNVIVEFQRISINIRDIFGKITGLLVVMIYTIGGSIMTAQSWQNGPPGKLLKDAANFCFAPDTLVKLKSGEIYKMCDVPLNSTLTNGARVRAVMTISNLDAEGCPKEEYYEIDGGENNTIIKVTGHHLVYDHNSKMYIYVKDLPGSRISKDARGTNFSCMITSNHTIKLGNRLFHDWEDNQSGSAW